MSSHDNTIIIASVVAFALVTVLGGIVYCRLRNGKKSEHPTNNKMDSIMPEGKRKKSITNPHLAVEIERAQKFRDRAKSVTLGRPEFKMSQKSPSKQSSKGETQLMADLVQQGYVQTGNSSNNLQYHDLNSNTAQNGHSGSDIENQNQFSNINDLPPDYIEQKQNYQYNRVNSLRNLRSNSYRMSPDIDGHSRKNSGTETPPFHHAPDTSATETSASPSPLRPISQPSGPRQNQYSPVPVFKNSRNSSPRSYRSQKGIAAQSDLYDLPQDGLDQAENDHNQFNNTQKSSPTVEYNLDPKHGSSILMDNQSGRTEGHNEGSSQSSSPKRSPRPITISTISGSNNRLELQ